MGKLSGKQLKIAKLTAPFNKLNKLINKLKWKK